MHFEHPQLRGAVIFANELLLSHTEYDAKRIHTSQWKKYVGHGEPLTLDQFQDSFRRRLFSDTMEMIFRSLHPKDIYMVRERYGFGGDFVSSYEIADQLHTMPITIINHLKKVNESLQDTAVPYLEEFRRDQNTGQLADNLLSLEPIYPYRKREQYVVAGKLTYLKP